MCHRNRIWTVALLAAGIGLILSCLFGSCFLRILVGVVLAIVGIFLSQS